MALSLVYFDPFEDYSSTQITRHWTYAPRANGYNFIQAGAGRNGTNSMRMTSMAGTDIFAERAIPASASALVMFAFRMETLPDRDCPITAFLDAIWTRHVSLRVTASGVLKLCRDATELANSGAFALSPGTWYHIAVAATIADAGTFDVWVDGTKVITGTGDTRNGGNAYADGIQLGTYATVYNMAPVDYDDLAIFTGATYTDADYPGDARAFSRIVNGDGTYTAWTASAGADSACVDDNPANDDTDYISSATPNDLASFAHAAIPGVGTVLGTMTVANVRMDDAGPRTVALGSRLGSTDLIGNPQSVSSSYAALRELQTTKPGGGAWTLSDVNASETVVKEVS